MAVMVNAMGGVGGGGGDLRGPIYLQEIRSTGTAGAFSDVVSLQGPGRLIQALATRSQANVEDGTTYDSSVDAIQLRIIPDGDASRTLKKNWRADACSSNAHLATFPMISSLSFPEIKNAGIDDKDYNYMAIPGHETIDYKMLKADRVVDTSLAWHSGTMSGIRLSFPGSVEGGGNDSTLTIYQDGLFFDESLVISGKWGRYLAAGFNGVILLYQLFT